MSVRAPALGTAEALPAVAPAEARDLRAAAAAALVSPWLHAGLLAFGIALRAVRYAADRSLRLDESYLALNLSGRSYGELLDVLDFGQGGPAGFLLGEKLVLDVLGDGEHALRLLPFAAGIASLFLFYAVARRLLTPLAVPFALLLFAVGEPFVVYSAMLKHYSLDVAVALAVLYVFLRVLERPRMGTRETLVLTATGLAAVWLSHPAAFVLAGVGAGLVAALLLRGDRRGLVALAVPFAVWLVSFGVMFQVTLRDFESLAEAATGFTGIFGSPPRNLYRIFRDINLDLLHWSADGLAPAVALVGAVAMWTRRRTRPWVVAGAAMVVALLAAGYLDRYAVGQRFILFLLPVAVLCLAEGGVRLVQVLPRELAATVAVVLVGVVLLPPLARAAVDLVRPPQRQELKPVLADLGARWREGDALYVASGTQYALRYYLECADCGDAVPPQLRAALRVRSQNGAAQATPALVSETPDVVIGSSHRPFDVARLRGRPRVWVLFSYSWPLTRAGVLEPVAEVGRQLECLPARGNAFTCLYDLSGAPTVRSAP